MNTNFIYKAGGLLIRDKKLLLNKQGGSEVYIVPGGQIEAGETPDQALVREMDEEFQIKVSSDCLEEIGSFDTPAVHHPGKMVRITTFLVSDWEGEIKSGNEIEGVVWVNSDGAKRIKVSPFTQNVVIPLLLERGLID